MYQESERLENKEAFIGTLSNFVTRLLLCLSFVLIVVLLPGHIALIWGMAWGISLLVVLTCILARYRNVSATSEVGKHLAFALAIILVSQRIGHWIAGHAI